MYAARGICIGGKIGTGGEGRRIAKAGQIDFWFHPFGKVAQGLEFVSIAVAGLGDRGCRQGRFIEIGKFADADQGQITRFDQRVIVAATCIKMRAHAAIINLLD